jgi:hypothetical protein
MLSALTVSRPSSLRARAAALGALFVVLVSVLIRAPFLTYVGRFGDEGILLQGATRMLNGDHLYLDFFEFLPPGGFILTAFWLAISDGSFVAARVLAVAVLVGIGCLTYSACLRVSRSIVASIGVTLVWTLLPRPELTQVSHNWFTTSLCMVSFVSLLAWAQESRGRLWLVVLAGLAGGMAAMITPNRGALVLLAGLTAFRCQRSDLRAVGLYCAAASFVPALLIAQLAWQGALEAAFDNVIVFTLTRYGAINYLPLGPNLLIFAAAGGFAVLLLQREGRRILGDGEFRLCAAFSLAALLGLLARADGDHVAYALPMVLPFLLLGAWHLTSARLHPVLAGILAASVLLSALGLAPRIWGVLHESPIATPRGTIRVTSEASEDIQALVRRVEALPQGEAIFVYPYSPLLPFLTGRSHAAKVNVLIPGYTTKDQYAEACRDVLRGARWVVTDDRWTSAGWVDLFPAIAEPEPRERMLFEAILKEATVPAGGYGIHSLRLIVNADASKCDAIVGQGAS